MIINIGKKDFEIKYTDDPAEIFQAIVHGKPKFITYDTESTGLHIKKDRPFLGAVCLNDKVFVFPTTKEILLWLPRWAAATKRIYAHNTTYDMHMTANMTDDETVLKIKNWGDTMGLARLTFEAISTRDGGDSLALKRIGQKYIDSKADVYEKQVKAWLKAKKAQDRKVLIALLRGIKDEKGAWSLKRFEAALNDGAEEVPTNVMQVFREWQINYPEPNYMDVPMDIMLPYVATDVIITALLVLKALPVIVFKQQQKIMEKEFRLIRTIFRMERVGIKVDREYLEDVNNKLEDYIQDLYTRLHLTAGVEFTAGQHAVIKELYGDILGETPKSTDKQFLKKMQDGEDKKAAELASLITKLRRLEKWKATYVEKILHDSEYDGRFYTQLNQFNPVSGRFSGDAQQFPKDPIKDEQGNILYHPRRAFLGHMYYLDYSQVELRVQGHYTMYFGGDTNLCRAYMPYKCTHAVTGEEYDYKSFEGRKRWIELREGAPTDLHWEDLLKEGWSIWINPDTNEPWVPTDVHSSTSLKALVVMGINPESLSKDELKWWRNIGKRFNFMRNYGGGDQMAAQTLEIKIEEARAMNRGYTEAFPKVITYQNGVVSKMRQKGYAENLYGRRYYINDWNKHYKCANYLIQGSCADFLKEKMILIDEYLEENDLWDKLPMFLCIHDELQFENINRDPAMNKHIAYIKTIMEDTPEILLPIVAECEMTETNWSEKKMLHVA